MKKKTTAVLVRQIKASQKCIAAERDKLRALVDEADAILENCEEADECLERAVDVLSQYL